VVVIKSGFNLVT